MLPNPASFFAQMPGQGGADPSDPLARTLEMMRQAWGSLGSLQAPVTPAMGLEELDRRITDLRAVENWLSLNLTMLRGSIQGLEVQRATIATLRSFAESMGGSPGASAPGGASPSPLDVVLGLTPGGAAPAAPKPAAPPPARAERPDAPAGAPGPDAAAPAADMPAAAQLWWNVLQQQFDRITQAAMPPASAPSAKPAAGGKPAAPRKRAAAPRKSAAPRKTAARR